MIYDRLDMFVCPACNRQGGLTKHRFDGPFANQWSCRCGALYDRTTLGVLMVEQIREWEKTQKIDGATLDLDHTFPQFVCPICLRRDELTEMPRGVLTVRVLWQCLCGTVYDEVSVIRVREERKRGAYVKSGS